MDIKKPLLLGTSLLLAFTARSQNSGQNYTISPYSAFGPGEPLGQNFVQAGAASQTFTGAYSYSLWNPATLGNIRFASLDFGLHGRMGMVQAGDQTQTFNGGSFNYLALAFNNLRRDRVRNYADTVNGRIIRKTRNRPVAWNSYLALYPTSSVGYNYTFESQSPFRNRTAHSGSGGITTFEWGQALKLGKHLNLGFSNGYLFGQLRDNSVFSVPDSLQLNFVEDDKTVLVRGFQHRAGVLFQFDADSTTHTFGASFGFHSGTRANLTRLTRTLEVSNTFSGTRLFVLDTILNNETGYRSFTMPTSFGLGYTFRWRRAWSVSLDYRKQMWSQYSAFFSSGRPLRDRTDLGFTFMLNPVDEKGPREKRMKLQMRIGGVLSQTQHSVISLGGPATVEEQRAFIGMGIPLTRRYYDNRVLRSVVNVQVDYLNRGQNISGMAREQYLMLTLGMNLGDIWFQRRKFD